MGKRNGIWQYLKRRKARVSKRERTAPGGKKGKYKGWSELGAGPRPLSKRLVQTPGESNNLLTSKTYYGEGGLRMEERGVRKKRWFPAYFSKGMTEAVVRF